MRELQTILQTRDLSVGYPSTGPLLRKLNLQLRQGELLCLLGPNGSGKSTLLRSLSRMHLPLKGDVLLQGKPMAHFSGNRLSQQLSVVLTERGMAPNLKVRELLTMGRYPYTGWFGRLNQYDHQIIRQVMEATDTQRFAERSLYALSDGERQKVMIARAMAQDTPLIILDEPTVHLDLPNRVEIMQLLRRLAHEQQKAILMSSHDLDLVIQSADQLWLVLEDRVVSGVPEDLILQGKLEQTFRGKNIRFDAYKGNFSIRKSAQHLIHFKEEDLTGYWTRQALERIGYKVVQDSSIRLRLNIEHVQSRPVWRLQGKEETVSCFSLEYLLQQLRSRYWPSGKEISSEG